MRGISCFANGSRNTKCDAVRGEPYYSLFSRFKIFFKKSRSFSTLPALNSAGVALNIANYWAVIGGSYADYIGIYPLTPVGGVALVSDRFGNAQGAFQTVSNSYAQAPSGIYFSGSFSVTVWVSVMNLSASVFFDFYDSSAQNEVLFSTSGLAVITNGAGSSMCFTMTCSQPLAVGQWYHLAVILNGGTGGASIYVNGVQTASISSGMTSVLSVTRLYNYFGRRSSGSYSNWIYDEIKFHTSVLSAAQVLSDYQYNQSYIALV
jgi:hypothetical protein